MTPTHRHRLAIAILGTGIALSALIALVCTREHHYLTGTAIMMASIIAAVMVGRTQP